MLAIVNLNQRLVKKFFIVFLLLAIGCFCFPNSDGGHGATLLGVTGGGRSALTRGAPSVLTGVRWPLLSAPYSPLLAVILLSVLTFLTFFQGVKKVKKVKIVKSVNLSQLPLCPRRAKGVREWWLRGRLP